MQRFVVAAAVVIFAAVAADAREMHRKDPRPVSGSSLRISLDRGPDAPGLLRSAIPAETTWLGSWTFDGGAQCTNDGWVSVDLTAQKGDYMHVDDFAGLGGGSFGLLVPLEGNQSLWCGARPDPNHPELCHYAGLPGYGNDWDQSWVTASCLPATGTSRVDFLITHDTEPWYPGDGDPVFVEYDHCDDNWQLASVFSGSSFNNPGALASGVDTTHSGSIRWRVRFTSDFAWSDEDGLFDLDGAFVLDSLTVTDGSGTVLPTELFEAETPGDNATVSGNWVSRPGTGYGDFAGLVSGLTVEQGNPCESNLTCMWAFFKGSTANYACGGFPSQPAVPYQNARGQFIDNQVWSPMIPLSGAGSDLRLEYDVYSEMTVDALVFSTWKVRSVVAGCPGSWRDAGIVYWYVPGGWYRVRQDLAPMVAPAATHIQVALGVVDRCDLWCGLYGTGDCHSHTPLYDNVEVVRIDSNGPVWSVRQEDLFQDTFATNGTINVTSTGRADMAKDVNPSSNSAIRPGDSTVVMVWDDQELATDPHTASGSAVYLYAGIWPQGQAGKSGAALTQDPTRWPVVDSTNHNGNTWYCIRADDADGLTDGYCVDLNDNLFTVGDTICFFFAAENTLGERTYWSSFTGTTHSLTQAFDWPDEFQILPGGGYNRGGDVLYVDGFDGHGAQPYFDTAFEMTGVLDLVDRFDIRAPERAAGNRLGSRVTNVFNQIIAPYRLIYWNTGDLPAGTIGDGTGDPEKSDDAFVLYTFIDQKPNTGGIYFSGDDLADELYNKQSPGANLVLLRTYIQGAVNPGDNNANAAGFGVYPIAKGEPGSCFDHVLGPDQFIAYGGCPTLNDFDVITPLATATLDMNYGGTPGQSKGAVIAQGTNNTAGADVGIILSGFSFHYIRDEVPAVVPARVHHFDDINVWLNQTVDVPTDARSAAAATTLSQNYPNPFNPVTSIAFTVKERTQTTLRIYNAAGQLVRTLVSDTRAPGVVHTVEWDGRSDAGSSVASGVYFYRLVTKEFTQTRKMVLLK